jgi:signal transduction histidine kinase/FixJ family two-component response regulator
MREKAPILLIGSLGIFLLSIFGIFRQRDTASQNEAIPHDLVAAEASLMDRFAITHQSLVWLFEQQGDGSSRLEAMHSYLGEHPDLITLAVLNNKGDIELVLPESEGALITRMMKQKDLRNWIAEVESRGKELFTSELGLVGGRQSLGHAMPILKNGRVEQLVLVVYDLETLLQRNLPKWVQQKYEAALVNERHRPLAKVNHQPSSELKISLRSDHDLSGHGLYLRLSAFPLGMGWPSLALLALGFGILISTSIILFNLSRDLQKRRLQAEDFQQQNKIIEAANSAKDQFIAGMSHEIRTPLSAIMGYTEILAARQSGSIPEIQGIRRNSQHLSKLLGDLLDYSRLQADILVPQWEVFSVASLVRELAAATVPQALLKGLPIEVRSLGDIPDHIHTDPLRLRQILMNLLGNAIKFTDQGRIILELEESQQVDHKFLRFRVEDSGLGIAEHEKGLLFQSFTQLASHQKLGRTGSGLGLAISRRLAEILQGRLYLESSVVDKGSRFVLEVDRYLVPGVQRHTIPPTSLETFLQHAGPVSESASIAHRVLRGRVILVTDDDDDNRQILAHLLTLAGAEVHEARSGAETLERMERTALSCILLDLSMPGMNGYETLARIQEQGLRIPIFALTASALSTERSKALAAGFLGFYTKPLSFQTFPELLAEQLHNILGKPCQEADAGPKDIQADAYKELRAQFCERLAARRERLQKAWLQRESLDMRKEAHSLVGTAAQYGFHDLAAAARQLEEACQDERMGPEAERAFQGLLACIDSVLSKH